MNSENIKALIIHDDKARVAEIKESLPDYFESVISPFDNALDAIISEQEKSPIGIVIMDAEDVMGLAIEVYKFLTDDPDRLKLRCIPVILLAEDEFSDKAMEFYDYGDPRFYTGDIMDVDFYLMVSELIEEAEDIPESELYPEDEEEENEVKLKPSIDKIMGATYEVSTGEGEQRVAAYNNAEILRKIASAALSNKEQAKKVISVLEKISAERISSGEKSNYIPRNERKKTVSKVTHEMPEFDDSEDWIPDIPQIQHEDTRDYITLEDLWGPTSGSSDSPAKNTNAQSIPSMGMPGMFVNPLNVQRSTNIQNASNPNVMKPKNYTIGQGVKKNGPKKILIIDTDPMSIKAFKLFVNPEIEIEQVDSMMRAIDFFIKKSADLVAIEYDMQGVQGLALLNNIRMQPNGRNVKAAIMMNQTKSQYSREKVLATPGVVGIIEKPIVKKQLLQTVNRAIQ